MSDSNKIRELYARISALYEIRDQAYPTLPLVGRTNEWTSFAKRYVEAAAVASRASPSLWLPAMQLTGQAIELALKACLVAADVEPPVEHDLVRLYCLVHSHGFELSEVHQACIVHATHFYHRDLATDTKYKARYPASSAEYLGGAVPEVEHFTALVGALCSQAQARADAAIAALLQSRQSARDA